jgi:hypothetical protein
MTVCCSTVSVAERGGPALDATKNPTSAEPRPLCGLSWLIQDASADTFQAHSASVLIEMLPMPPSADTAPDGGATETSHRTGVGATDVMVVDPQATTVTSDAAAAAATVQRLMRPSDRSRAPAHLIV